MSMPDEKDQEVQEKVQALDRLLGGLPKEDKAPDGNTEPSREMPPTLQQNITANGPNAKVAGGNFYDLSSQIPVMGKENPNAIICPQCHQITGRLTPECKGSLNCGYPVKKHFDTMDQNIADLEWGYQWRFGGAVVAPFALGVLYKDIPGFWFICILASGMLAYRGYEKYQACEKAKAERSKFIPS